MNLETTPRLHFIFLSLSFFFHKNEDNHSGLVVSYDNKM